METVLTVQVGITADGEIEGLEQGMEDAKAKLDGYIQYPKWVENWRLEKVRALKCFEVVREMLLNSIPTIEVARQVQGLGEMKEIGVDTVRVHLEHFKQTLPKALMISRMNPLQYVETKKQIDATIDSLQVLSQLTEKMMKRIDIAMAREAAMNFLMPNVEKQFAVCMELACRIHDMKKDLGVTNEQASQIMNRAAAVSRVDWDKTYSKPGLNEVMANPESRVRVIRFMEDMTAMFGKMPKDQQERILQASKKTSGKKDGNDQGA